jgi:hypothetical protein
MRYLKPQAWLDWQLMEEKNETWCLIRCNFNTQEYQIIKNFYVRMQITRFFKQGYSIVETGNDEALAALNPEKTELIVAILNKLDQPKPFTLNLKSLGISGKEMEVYRTTTSENCSKIQNHKIKDRLMIYNAPRLSLTTFVITLEN